VTSERLQLRVTSERLQSQSDFRATSVQSDFRATSVQSDFRATSAQSDFRATSESALDLLWMGEWENLVRVPSGSPLNLLTVPSPLNVRICPESPQNV
jgi:hypothetical protein